MILPRSILVLAAPNITTLAMARNGTGTIQQILGILYFHETIIDLLRSMRFSGIDRYVTVRAVSAYPLDH